MQVLPVKEGSLSTARSRGSGRAASGGALAPEPSRATRNTPDFIQNWFKNTLLFHFVEFIQGTRQGKDELDKKVEQMAEFKTKNAKNWVKIRRKKFFRFRRLNSIFPRIWVQPAEPGSTGWTQSLENFSSAGWTQILNKITYASGRRGWEGVRVHFGPHWAEGVGRAPPWGVWVGFRSSSRLYYPFGKAPGQHYFGALKIKSMRTNEHNSTTFTKQDKPQHTHQTHHNTNNYDSYIYYHHTNRSLQNNIPHPT